MTDTNKILIGVGSLAVVGLGIYLITKKDEETTTTTTTGGQMIDPSASTVDSLGTTIGNLFNNIWGKTQNSNSSCNYNGPVDAYTADGVDKDDYDKWQIEEMQMTLSNKSADIKKIIDGTGGVDGIIGPGFKEAYNMARQICGIVGIRDLERQSNI